MPPGLFLSDLMLSQPENLEKQGRMLPRPVRAWPPRENGKFDSVGQLPPVKSISGGAGVSVPVPAA